MAEHHTRRRVLKMGAALGGAAAVGSLSGCSAVLGGGSVPYTNWLYAPGAVGETEHYTFQFRDDKQIRSNEDALEDETYGALTPGEDSTDREVFEQMGLDYDDLTTTVTVGEPVFTALGDSSPPTSVFLGNFSGKSVIDELEDKDFTKTDNHERFRILTKQQRVDDGFTTQDIKRVYAVNSGVAIFAEVELETRGGEDDKPGVTETIETVIDTEAGEQERYIDADEDMSELTDELSPGTFSTGGTHEETEETNADLGNFKGEVAAGLSWTIDGQTTETRYVSVFGNSSDIDTESLETWVNGDVTFFGSDVSISEKGRTVVVTGETDTQEVFGASSGS
jgi:hypothetical protein